MKSNSEPDWAAVRTAGFEALNPGFEAPVSTTLQFCHSCGQYQPKAGFIKPLHTTRAHCAACVARFTRTARLSEACRDRAGASRVKNFNVDTYLRQLGNPK